MDVGAASVADGQTAAAVHPGMEAFHHPVGPSQPGAALNSSQGNPRRDAAGPALLATALVVVTLVGVELVRPLFRTAFPPRRGGIASSVGASIRLSCWLAGPDRRLSGVPRASVTRWRFVSPYRDPSCSGSSRLPPPFAGTEALSSEAGRQLDTSLNRGSRGISSAKMPGRGDGM
ncbi:MAG: hypothetical protein JWP20_655 [Roseomonas sp.]|nr:hypothetical protein [Roseomonas sp.]